MAQPISGVSRLMIYDGNCGLCAAAARLVSRLDVLGHVRADDVNGDWSRLSQEHPELDRHACLAAMHVIGPGDRVRAGFDACRSLVWALPIAWPLLPLLYVPGVPAIGRRLYRAAAARRARTCAL